MEVKLHLRSETNLILLFDFKTLARRIAPISPNGLSSRYTSQIFESDKFLNNKGALSSFKFVFFILN